MFSVDVEEDEQSDLDGEWELWLPTDRGPSLELSEPLSEPSSESTLAGFRPWLLWDAGSPCFALSIVLRRGLVRTCLFQAQFLIASVEVSAI